MNPYRDSTLMIRKVRPRLDHGGFTIRAHLSDGTHRDAICLSVPYETIVKIHQELRGRVPCTYESSLGKACGYNIVFLNPPVVVQR